MPAPLRASAGAAVAAMVAIVLTACTGDDSDDRRADAPDRVTLVTHDEFVLSDELLQQFEEESGIAVEVDRVGNVNTLLESLLERKGAPHGDVVLGVDNTFRDRIADEGVTETNYLWQVGRNDVCVNADTAWFAEQDLHVPTDLDDLADPRYDGLLAVPDPVDSALGVGFVLAGVDEYGEAAVGDYWEALRENDVLVAESAQEAYASSFTAGPGEGDRPLVVARASSPVDTLGDDGTPTTTALPETCFLHEEYAGLLENAAHREEGRALLEFLTSRPVEAGAPASMELYPTQESIHLPRPWARHAPLPAEPHDLDADELTEKRTAWIGSWVVRMHDQEV